MTPPDASTVAAPSADPMDTLFDDGIPTTDFPIDVVNQLGETTSKAKATDQVTVTDGEVAPKPEAKAEPIVEVGAGAEKPVDEPEVGEPYQIGKDGRVRGPDGRFTDKPKADPEAADAKAASDVSEVKPVPFKYRTMGETKDLEGATLDAKGNLTIPADKVGLARAALNALHVRDAEVIPTMQKTQSENVALKARVQQLETGTTAKEAQAQAVLSRFDAIMKEPDDEKFVEEMFKFRAGLPQLTLQAERDYWEKQAKEGKTVAVAPAKPATDAARPAPSTAGLPSQEEVLESVTEQLAHLKIDHAYHDVSDKDWQQFETRVARTPMAYVRAATQKDATAHGVTIGEPVFDTDLLMDDVTQHVSGLREQRAAALKREQLAADNSRRTTPQVTTPPTVTTTKAPVAKKSDGFTSREEVERWLESPEL